MRGGTAGDRTLLEYVNRVIRTGTKTAVVPAELLQNATDSAITEARQLARLCGVRLVVHGS